jgi:hypothetical protein
VPRSLLNFHQQKIVRELVRAHRTGRHKGAFSHVEMAAAQWIQIVGAKIDATRGDCEALAANSFVSLRYGPRGEPTMLLREEAYEAVRTNFGIPRKASVFSAIQELTHGDQDNAVLASQVAQLTGLSFLEVTSDAQRLAAEGRIASAAPEQPEVPGDVYYSLIQATAARSPEPARAAAPPPTPAPIPASVPALTGASAPAPPARGGTPPPLAPAAGPPAQRTASAGTVHDIRAHFEDLAAQQVALTRAIDALLAQMSGGEDDPGELKRLVLDLWLKSKSAVEFAGGVAELAQAFKLI